MNRLKALLLIMALSIFTSLYAKTEEFYSFDDPQKRKQFSALLKELRCLVCQNQDLADSNAELATDLKNIVYKKVLNHESDQQIKTFLIERYGDFVTFSPPFKQLTIVLWFAPFILLIMFLLGYAAYHRKTDK